ncbi:hypothetical protein [Desulfofalx alkaliphila]|uniref:hypothetical protein n=1 Tax=Desulfofalx alkaliphila TaxID=105483 RepID=UPI001EE3D23E|nr:hypothetical protein [Desulfofalx alkaliphila]
MYDKNNMRIKRMALSAHDISILNKKAPWITMWWSAALPGLGHLCNGAYLRGLLIMSWEIIINLMSHLNLAILYTFTGNIKKSVEVLDIGWVLFYGVVFCFAIFDSYRLSVEVNIITQLERKQSKHHYNFLFFNTLGINFVDKKRPWVALVWSMLLAGFGHLYNMRLLKASILLVWTIVIIYFSNMNNAIVATFTGNFARAKEIVDYQWLMFFPSIYFYAMWDSYNDAVQHNKLFNEQQKSYLQKKYACNHRR